MRNGRMVLWILPALCALGVGSWAQEAATNRAAPVIRHEPVLVAAQGQPITLRAIVTDDAGKVKSVSLFYSTSRDVAPFKLPMQTTGADVYLVTIPGSLLTGARQVSYYIEAANEAGDSSETRWHLVELQTSQPLAGSAGPKEKSSWTKPALYAGGAAALIGAGIWAANRGGGGSSGGSATNTAGSYAGSVTTCLEMSGSAPSCSSHTMTILITSDGVVNSGSLREGAYMEGHLSGADFTLVSAVSETNLTGELRYEGTVLNGRINGSVRGSAHGASGTNGVYSGTFNATAQ